MNFKIDRITKRKVKYWGDFFQQKSKKKRKKDVLTCLKDIQRGGGCTCPYCPAPPRFNGVGYPDKVTYNRESHWDDFSRVIFLCHISALF